MPDLHAERIKSSAVFENVGTDLCGLFQIKVSNLRTSRAMKIYIVVFVCMATKAIHLELYTQLTTNAFLAEF